MLKKWNIILNYLIGSLPGVLIGHSIYKIFWLHKVSWFIWNSIGTLVYEYSNIWFGYCNIYIHCYYSQVLYKKENWKQLIICFALSGWILGFLGWGFKSSTLTFFTSISYSSYVNKHEKRALYRLWIIFTINLIIYFEIYTNNFVL